MKTFFDFDSIIERHNTHSVKWDIYGSRDILPLWVADMDFASPPAVIEALHRRVDHGIFGYTMPPPELGRALRDQLRMLYAWHIEEDWVTWLPGLVSAINIACRSTGTQGGTVVASTPVYPPFLTAPEQNDRFLRTVPMIIEEGIWRHDYDALQSALKGASLYLLCSPHNPVGRVLTTDELKRIGEICERENVVVCSDEIHNRLILDGIRHVPTASLSDSLARRTITLISPSKTYNLAGIGCACAIISNAAIRRRFRDSMKGVVPHVGIFGYTAALAAYTRGESWLSALLDYLRSNRNLVEEWVCETPGMTMSHVEATYLAWLDVRSLELDDPAGFFEEHGVGLWRGDDFGTPGFLRLNFGCPRSVLERALDRMKDAVAGR